MFEREVLLNLKRLYSKDETVALLTKRLAEVEFKLGEYASELSELLDENKQLKKQIKDTAKSEGNDQQIKELNKQVTKMGQKNAQLKKEAEKWRDRYCEISRHVLRPEKYQLPTTDSPPSK